MFVKTQEKSLNHRMLFRSCLPNVAIQEQVLMSNSLRCLQMLPHTSGTFSHSHRQADLNDRRTAELAGMRHCIFKTWGNCLLMCSVCQTSFCRAQKKKSNQNINSSDKGSNYVFKHFTKYKNIGCLFSSFIEFTHLLLTLL